MVKIGRLGLFAILLAACATVVEFVYLSGEHDRQERAHREKMARIQAVKESMAANVGRYRSLLAAQSEMNKQVLSLLGEDSAQSQANLSVIEKNWNQEYARRMLEVLDQIKSEDTRNKVLRLIIDKTGVHGAALLSARCNWILNQLPAPTGSDYANFKALLYHRVDPRFLPFFAADASLPSEIRLDQVWWNGAVLDERPPLNDPKLVSASAAGFMKPAEKVFCAQVGGESFACPRRILLWHDTVSLEIGDKRLTGVYDDVDDTMSLYDMSTADGVQLGNSGFSYAGGKLLYDERTKSLWSAAQGTPVIGSMVKSKIVLTSLPVENCTWEKWHGSHPQTLVISTDTGFDRDYSTEAAEKARH